MKHHWGDKRRRAIVRDYALRYLGVERLPRGLGPVLRALGPSPHPDELRAILRPYRRPAWVL